MRCGLAEVDRCVLCSYWREISQNLHQPFLQSTIAQAATSKPVALHRLGTRKVTQSRCERAFRYTIMHSRSKFNNDFIRGWLVPEDILACVAYAHAVVAGDSLDAVSVAQG